MLITVFTPTYNRAHLLPRLYESLCRQTFKDFEWVIVDDGSTDGTSEMFHLYDNDSHNVNQPALCENKNGDFNFQVSIFNSFKIRYYYQENGGKHRAINRGVKEARGELFLILDSDDYLPNDALEIVVNEWNVVKGIDNIGGIAGLDCYDHGGIVGSGLPQPSINCNAIDIRLKHHVTGDLKEVFRTDVLRKFPFPEIAGERFCPEQLVWFRIAQKYDLHYFNKPVYIAEYQEEGITAHITRARMKSPIASMMTYAELNSYDIPFISKVKAAINYWRFRLAPLQLPPIGGVPMPKLRWWWNWVAPVGYLMHLKDGRLCKG